MYIIFFSEYCMMYSINEARRAEKTTFTSPTISSSADGHCLSMTYTSDMDVGCGGSIKQSTWESDEYREVTILEQHSEKNLLKYNLTAVEPFSVSFFVLYFCLFLLILFGHVEQIK